MVMRFGIAILRAVVGGLFIGHGLQKLTGAFGGHGLEGTAGVLRVSSGLQPGKVHATAAGVAETGGGALLVAGAATPLAAGRADRHDDRRDPQGPPARTALGPERRLRVPAGDGRGAVRHHRQRPGRARARPPRVGHRVGDRGARRRASAAASR